MYTAATGMIASQAAQDAIAQNLANASTTGYKQDVPIFAAFEDALTQNLTPGTAGPAIGRLGRGVQFGGLATDFAAGALQQTGNPLDIALTGDAFLAVQTPQGVRYSRDGSLARSAQGDLVQAGSGFPVLDAGGRPIRIPARTPAIQIDTQGALTAGGRSLGRLNLVGLRAADSPVKVGDNLFFAARTRPISPGATVRQGYLESSNVSVVREMVAMISVQRAYETGQKMIQAEDDVTGKAVNEVAKV